MVSPHPLDPFPRNRASLVKGLVGQKVVLSTTDFHYLVGRLTALGEDDVLVLSVNERVVQLPRASLATIQPAGPELPEYVK